MSRFQKIFLASVLVVVGFGVAKFLGQPVALTKALNSPVTQPLQAPSVTAIADSAPIGAFAAGRARLLPDTPAIPVAAVASSAEIRVPEPPSLSNALAQMAATADAASVSTAARSVDDIPVASAPYDESESPRARLRNEAPRPIGVDPHSPATIRRMPTALPQVTDRYAINTTTEPPAGAMHWSAPPLMNTGFSDAKQSPPIAVAASYNAPASSAVNDQVAPPPWPTTGEISDLRTHIIVDGDSLERLANRYLADPKRSREIYELNREVLSAPDLLPIGAELKIPQRLASASQSVQGFQPNSANANSNREVGRDNWTSVRPAATPQEIIPRAQLARPITVE